MVRPAHRRGDVPNAAGSEADEGLEMNDLVGLEMWDYGAWFHFPLVFMTFLSVEESVLLAFLINHYTLNRRNGNHKEGWVECTSRIIQKYIPMHRNTITKAIAGLASHGVITTKVEGLPAIRRFRVDGETLSEKARKPAVLSDAQKLCNLLHTECAASCTKNVQYIKQQVVNNTPSHRSGTEKLFHVDNIHKSPYKGFAQRLLVMVSTVRKVNATSNPNLWYRSFEQLHRKGIPDESVDAVLTWYAKILKEHGDLTKDPEGHSYWQPVAYSGPKFKEIWDKLENAMQRYNAKHGLRTKDPIKERRLYTVVRVRKEREISYDEYKRNLWK